ncbi:flagellar hook-associated protein FlgL [Domibacillus sp. DTU_2020_1001157_1_SI_ALB_TIR_016]|uniref:flagellar hook-associated protein FlgL n=1 Tax=Domibacillus sp. DTU_2020_1001157_1_SI_ALB_TIR_016 TaxID=3077789 RepID=UPI0028EDF6BF|nr:flagellar hook-associated protein FlgL [Domibacillus sp. DTU_2020_1001157_1_SI_ALB_TIR_016]WNS81298.1 flagellar hook-associated protein FlgL [Domibacillus sp. DTU_2020_1001157_1_SI_ALB_TIR_016]
MRVTQSMLSSNMMKNLTSSLNRLDKLNTQVSTQKKIDRPSDDPVVAMKGITYRRTLLEVEQYQRNFGEAYNWVENSDTSLDKASQALQRMRELLVQTSSDTYDAEQRKAAKEEIDQLKEHLVEIANTKFGDKYLFNGTNTVSKPVDLSADPPAYPVNDDPVELELSKGVYIQVNISGKTLFSEDMFAKIDEIAQELDKDASSTSGEALSGLLKDLDTHMATITDERAKLGAKYNRVELMEARIGEQEVIANRILSENEDVDFERVVTDLTVQETVHNAALSVGARIIQPTLMDFLR